MKNIVLIGMMGSGKTSVAIELSRSLSLKMVDTDDMIERLKGHTVSEIFKHYGEEHFRSLEAEIATKLKNQKNLIIATGGGFIVNPLNMKAMKENGIIFYLKGSSQVLLDRIGDDESRPLANPLNFEAILSKRDPIYNEAADYIIDVDKKEVAEIANEIIKNFLQRGEEA